MRLRYALGLAFAEASAESPGDVVVGSATAAEGSSALFDGLPATGEELYVMLSVSG